ncbi:MAG: ABC transporter permease subunit [Lachnospiraceae bacterium]|nr:ABC transporter permease subunit [Lachnospiraceae bacterium]
MKRLIYNELNKIIKQKIVFVPIIALVVFCFLYAKLNSNLKVDESYNSEDWKVFVENEIKAYENRLENMSKDNPEYETVNYEYQLLIVQRDCNISENDWRYLELEDCWNAMNEGDIIGKELFQAIKENDWRAFYKIKLDDAQKNIKKVEKGEYEYSYYDDVIYECSFRLNNNIEPTRFGTTWDDKTFKELQFDKESLKVEQGESAFNRDYEAIEKLKNSIIEKEYRLKNHIPSNDEISLGSFLNGIFDYKYIFIIIVVCLSANCICQEYLYGMLKNLYLDKYERYKIVISKIISLNIVSIILLLVIFGASFMAGTIFYKNEINDVVLIINERAVRINFFFYLFIKYLLVFFETLIFSVITIMIGVLINSIIANIMVMLFIILAVPKVASYLYVIQKMNFVKWIPTLNYSYTDFLDHTVFNCEMNLFYAIIVGIISLIVSILLSCRLAKKDI